MLIPFNTPGWHLAAGLMTPLEGTEVRIREWKDMEGEYGSSGDIIHCASQFVGGMRPLCGKTFIVLKVSGIYRHAKGAYASLTCSTPPFSSWSLTTHMVEPIGIRKPLTTADIFVQQLQTRKQLLVTLGGANG